MDGGVGDVNFMALSRNVNSKRLLRGPSSFGLAVPFHLNYFAIIFPLIRYRLEPLRLQPRVCCIVVF